MSSGSSNPADDGASADDVTGHALYAPSERSTQDEIAPVDGEADASPDSDDDVEGHVIVDPRSIGGR